MDPYAEAIRSFNLNLRLLTTTLAEESRDSLVEAGSILYKMERGAHGALEKIKERLRVEALKQDLDHCCWEGVGRGVVTVSIPKHSLRLRKDADMDALRATLGSDFDEHFETLYRLRKGATKRLATAQKNTRESILSVCNLTRGKPRVSFQRK